MQVVKYEFQCWHMALYLAINKNVAILRNYKRDIIRWSIASSLYSHHWNVSCPKQLLSFVVSSRYQHNICEIMILIKSELFRLDNLPFVIRVCQFRCKIAHKTVVEIRTDRAMKTYAVYFLVR